MKLLGTTVEINRGEVFTLSWYICDNTGKPYMISSDATNPFMLITVSSNTYELKGKWSKNYWLDLSGYPTFDNMTEVYIESTSATPEDYEALYYILDLDGTKTYYRYDRILERYVEYKFMFSKLFLNSDTSEWIESIYNYEVRLVDGRLMSEFLTSLFVSLFPDVDVPVDVETIYKTIYKIKPELVQNIDYTAPLVNISEQTILLKPSKIIVKANT